MRSGSAEQATNDDIIQPETGFETHPPHRDMAHAP